MHVLAKNTEVACMHVHVEYFDCYIAACMHALYIGV